jgi:DUF4097 and DUF4098 domain-containing protein YvlB
VTEKVKMRLQVLWVTALVAGAILPTRADESYVKRGTPQHQGRLWAEDAECTVPVKEGGRLVFRADLGSVNVRPGAPDRLQCSVHLTVYAGSETEARNTLGHYELIARRAESGGAYLSGKLPSEKRQRRSLCVSFDLQVPAKFNLDLETQGGGVDVSKLEGELRAVTAGGDIHTGDVSGPVRVETAGGAIDLANIAQRVEAHTAGGGIHVGNVRGDATLETSGGEIVAGMVQGTLRAETAGGDIVLRGASGPIYAETAGGQIQLGQCGANVRAETAGGSIHVDTARGRVEVETAGGGIDLMQVMSGVRAETAAGPIVAHINATRGSFVPSSLETSVGDIHVFVAPDLPLTIDAVIEEAMGHQIQSDFPLSVRGEQRGFVAGTVEGRGTLQGGGNELKIHTVMGSIEIRKLDAGALLKMKQSEDEFWQRWQERWQERQQHLNERLRMLQDNQQRMIEERERGKQQHDHDDDDDQ